MAGCASMVSVVAAAVGLAGSVGATCWYQGSAYCCDVMNPSWLRPKCTSCPGVPNGCCLDAVILNVRLDWTWVASPGITGAEIREIDDTPVSCSYKLNSCVPVGEQYTCELAQTASTYSCYPQYATGTSCQGAQR